MVGIYKITNKETGDFYIGQSRRLEKRLRAHFQKYIKPYHSKKFKSDIEKYGRDGFKIEILEYCDVSELIQKERYYINKLKPTYNTVYDGHLVTPEQRAKISRSLTGRKQSPEMIEKRRKGILERHKIIPQLNEGHRKKIAVQKPEGITVYESVKSTAKMLGVHPSTVSQALKKGHKVKGFKVWYAV